MTRDFKAEREALYAEQDALVAEQRRLLAEFDDCDAQVRRELNRLTDGGGDSWQQFAWETRCYRDELLWQWDSDQRRLAEAVDQLDQAERKRR